MEEILVKIRQADDFEIGEIITAVIQRYQEVFPNWEVMFLSLPRDDPDACIEKLQIICKFIRDHNSRQSSRANE